ncbi:MAG: hypothetical protein VX740_05720 [Pseudomonadota bacterium]|jgi:hypothetical protein|nr:hypothetical protein [Pseudomonadota bacterium]MEC9236494.1 hypothetical protein [Pseudomonadota bacterium]MED5422920.1 hypothetical protein [Pseudomonadota bacterium]MEE3322368.1 hypothetical protein [Pseudomonadota bacterium]
MKKIIFLIGFIVLTISGLHLYALPPLFNFVLKTELEKRGFIAESYSTVKLSPTHTALTKAEFTKQNINITYERVLINNSALLTLIQRKAPKITIQSPYVFIDTTSAAYIEAYGRAPLESLLHAPHKITNKMLSETLRDLSAFASFVSFENIKIDVLTTDGLISIGGDLTLNKGQILGSFSSAQKQLTLNAQLNGQLDVRTTLDIQADNINIDLPQISLKRGIAHFRYKENGKLPSTAFELQASLASFGDMSLSTLEITAKALKNGHKIHIKSRHGNPQENNQFNFWYNVLEGQVSTYLQSENSDARDILALYESPKKIASKHYSRLIGKFFLSPQDVIIQTQALGQQKEYRLSLLSRDDGQIFKGSALENKDNILIQINNTPLTATQVQAISSHFMQNPLYEFSGDAQLYGNALILKNAPDKLLLPENSEGQAMTLSLKNSSFKNKAMHTKKASGQIKLTQGTNSALSFELLSAQDLSFKKGRLSFRLNAQNQVFIDQLRATLGTGSFTMQHNSNAYIINGRRVNATSIPSIFWPSNDALQQLVNIDAQATQTEDQNIKLNAEYLVIANNKKSRKKLETRNLDTKPDYLRILEHAP